VFASTQNQILCAILFLYRDVLNSKLDWIENIRWSKKPSRIPVVFTVEEAQKVIVLMDGQQYLMISLLYGSGLRFPNTSLNRVILSAKR
jgi:site-specific recombinase XerD